MITVRRLSWLTAYSTKPCLVGHTNAPGLPLPFPRFVETGSVAVATTISGSGAPGCTRYKLANESQNTYHPYGVQHPDAEASEGTSTRVLSAYTVLQPTNNVHSWSLHPTSCSVWLRYTSFRPVAAVIADRLHLMWQNNIT